MRLFFSYSKWWFVIHAYHDVAWTVGSSRPFGVTKRKSNEIIDGLTNKAWGNISNLFSIVLGCDLRVAQLCLLTLNVWGPSHLGLTRSMSWLLMLGSLRRQDISNHDIDCVKYASPVLIRGRISTIYGFSVWRKDININTWLCSLWWSASSYCRHKFKSTWLIARQSQAIFRTNVDFSLLMLSGIRLKAL